MQHISRSISPPKARMESLPTSRKRRIRKGTRSCWECKRKKIKCTFAAATDSICDSCKRRGTKCTSQAFPESLGTNRRQLGDRLVLVEELVGQLMKDASNTELQESSSANMGMLNVSPASEGVECQYSSIPSNGSRFSSSVTASGPSEADRHSSRNSSTWSALISDTIDIRRDNRAVDRYTKISQALLEAWPSKQDRDIILSGRVDSTSFFCGVVCTPYSGLADFERPSPEEILQIPQSGTHPVLIARKLIMIGAYLQGFPPRKTQELTGLSTSIYDIMHRAVETAVRLVTSNDDLVGSVEVIECIFIESMFQNSEGNLRRAYLSMRRALVLAQMIGLDKARCINSPLLKFIDPATKMRIDPVQMWFRLLQSDRYLSLMLGLPQGTADNSFATAAALEDRTPVERLERLDCSAAGRIIQRNSADMHDIKMTQEIDQLLQDAAALMPPKWWLTPDLSLKATIDLDAIHDTIRFIDQFTHYHLLERLHLPYLLHPSTDPRYNYSKTTAIIASRELLSRFIPFRNSHSVGSFCRGLDFLAFTASTALCLAHINAHHQKAACTDGGGALLSFLSHQRPSDRGMLEQVLENMMDAARPRNDITATRIASITQHLLAIEADAALGGRYTTDSSYNADEEEIECNGKLSDGGAVLRIYIPYFGTIKIERHGISRSDATIPPSCRPAATVNQLDSEPVHTGHEQYQTATEGSLMDCSQPVFGIDTFPALDGQCFVAGLESGSEWDLQGVDLALFDSVFRFRGDE